MSSFDIPKQFGDPQWAKDAKNLQDRKYRKEVPQGVTTSDKGGFKDLQHFMNASEHYASQLEKAGKPTEEQIATGYKNWLGDPNKANLLTVLRTYHKETR